MSYTMLASMGLMSVVNLAQQNRDEKQAAKRQAKLSIFNAEVEEARQGQIAKETRRRQKESRRLGRRVMGQQRAQVAGSGFSFVGQPTQLIAETAARVELDALIIGKQGAAAISESKHQAALDRLQASDIKSASKIKRGQRAMQTGVELMNLYAGYQRASTA